MMIKRHLPNCLRDGSTLAVSGPLFRREPRTLHQTGLGKLFPMMPQPQLPPTQLLRKSAEESVVRISPPRTE
eukprot:scaffold73313_cov27-Tisochrysis_lutea.AAC.7